MNPVPLNGVSLMILNNPHVPLLTFSPFPYSFFLVGYFFSTLSNPCKANGLSGFPFFLGTQEMAVLAALFVSPEGKNTEQLPPSPTLPVDPLG